MPRSLRRGTTLRLTVLAALLGLTAWNLTRSDALARAERLELDAASPGENAEALRLALAHLDRQPWSGAAARLAGRCLSRLDYPDLAEPYYRRGGNLDLADLQVRANAILRADRREQAIAAYKAILARWPDDTDSVRRLAGLYYSRKQYEDALAQARRLASLPGGEVDGHRLASLIYHESGSPEPAVAEAEAALAIDPDLATIPSGSRQAFWYRYPSDLLAIGRADEARRQLERVLTRTDDPGLRVILGRAAFQLGDFELAERSWRQAVEARPDLAIAWLELGRLELARNRPAEAIEPLQRARTLVETDTSVLYSLRAAYLRLNRAEEAREVGQELERLRRTEPPPTGGMGASRVPAS